MPQVSGSRVLVTGAAGFVGANLVRGLLRAGAEVHALVRPGGQRWRLADLGARIRCHGVDIASPGAVAAAWRKIRPAFVFHAAAAPGHPVTPAERHNALRVNVLGTANLLEAARELPPEKFVHLGSSLEYGSRGRPLLESDDLRPVCFRGAVKAGAALLCRERAAEGSFPVVLLRLFAVYGPWEDPRRLIPVLIRACAEGLPVDLTASICMHDYVFTEDVVEACIRAAESGGVAGAEINIGSGVQSSNEEVLRLVSEIMGVTLEVRRGGFPARAHDTSCWVTSVVKARELLGWEPRWTLRAGLQAEIEWFRGCGYGRDLYTNSCS